MKKLLLAVTATLALTACQTTPIDTAAGIILASDKIDLMQTELGEFSSNQEALKELDSLQADIKNTMTTGGDILSIESYHARTVITYETFKREIKTRWSELTAEQQAKLIALDNDLIEINANIVAMKNSANVKSEVLEMIYRATVLMSYYKGI